MAKSLRVGIKDVLGMVKKSVPAPLKKQAFSVAAKFGVKKGLVGKMNRTAAVKLVKELKSEHLLKAQVGREEKISTSANSAKRILETTVESAKSGPSAAEINKEHLAEKREILKEAGLKQKEPHKVNMERALDKTFVDGEMIRGNDDAKQAKHSTVEGLKTLYRPPHHEAEPPRHQDDQSVMSPKVQLEETDQEDNRVAPAAVSHAPAEPNGPAPANPNDAIEMNID